MNDFFETRTAGRLADVRSRLEAELKARKMGILHVHDIKATLDAKGVGFATSLLVLDICNPGHAKAVLEATGNQVAPLLPCSIALWQDGGDVVIRFLRPMVMARFFGDNAVLTRTSAEVEAAMAEAATAATSA